MSQKRKSAEKTDQSENDLEEGGSASESGAQPSDGNGSEEKDPAAEPQIALDRYLRLAAEFENYKKRVQKDQADYTKFANERLLKELLPVLDNLQRALEHARQAGGTDSLIQGVELTCKQYVETLARFGVKPIPSVGLPFDPAVHQAVATVEPKDGQGPNTIVMEHEKGYYLHDRVLRPAMVTVTASRKAVDDYAE